MAKTASKVIFNKQFLTEFTISWCSDVCSVWPTQIFQVQAKKSTVRPVFPDYLSVSYDHGFAQCWSCFWIRMIQQHQTTDYSLNQKELNKIHILNLSYKKWFSAYNMRQKSWNSVTSLLICFDFNNCQIVNFLRICENTWIYFQHNLHEYIMPSQF